MKRVWLVLFFSLLFNVYFVSSAVLFESDWGTALGTGTDAVHDTSKPIPWDSGSDVNQLIVVTAASEGITNWPSENLLLFKSQWRSLDGGSEAASVRLTGGDWPIPNPGESLFFRYYLNIPSEFAIGSGPTDHPIENTIGGGGQMDWWTGYAMQDGYFTLGFATGSSPNGTFSTIVWDLATARGVANAIHLQPNHTYRLEWQIYVLNATTWELHAKLYDGNGTLLYNDDDFHRRQGPVGTLATIPNQTFNSKTLDYLDVGSSAINGNEWNLSIGLVHPVKMYRWGAFCVRDDDWCGAYNASQGGQNDTTSPIRSSGLPSGLFPFNTTQATLSLTTNEAATCRYGTTPGTAYASIANTFTTTGSTSHSQLITGLIFNTTYNYYFRCNDTAGNVNTNDFNITFRISHAPNFTYNWNEWWTNETTNFTMFNASYLQNITNVRFVNQYGRIHFLQGLNLSSDLDLTNRIKVLDKKVWINSSLIPEFNRSAQLTFTGVGFSNPIVKIDGVDCPAEVCQNVTFNQTTGTYSINVTSFSVYEVVEQCEDNVQNYDETGKDCGGKCGECGNNNWVWVIVGALVIVIAVYLFGKKKR